MSGPKPRNSNSNARDDDFNYKDCDESPSPKTLKRRNSKESVDSANSLMERVAAAGLEPAKDVKRRLSWGRSADDSPGGAPVQGPCPTLQRLATRALGTQYFDMSIGIVILANSITLGLDQSLQLEGKKSIVIEVMEHVFLVIYVLELSFRFLALGLSCLEDNWVKFDTLLVVCGVGTNWILEPILGSIEGLGPLLVLRSARLLRLARAVRLLVRFRELWMLVRGFQSSAGTMFYTLVMLTMVLYIFGCMGVELITNHRLADDDPVFQAQVETYFRSLPVTMMTLVQFVTLDSMHMIYVDLVVKDYWLGLYFLALILIVSIVLMNLITAVLVNSALEQALADKDAIKHEELKQRKRLMKKLRGMFIRLDEDESGEISREEIMMMTDEDKQLFHSVMGLSNPVEVFDAIDVDHSGGLDLDEFCDGIWAAAISKTPIEMRRLEKQVLAIHEQMMGDLRRVPEESCDVASAKDLARMRRQVSGEPPLWAQKLEREIQDLKEKISEIHGALEAPSSRGPRAEIQKPRFHHAEANAIADFPAWMLKLSSQMCQEIDTFRFQMQDAVLQLQARLNDSSPHEWTDEEEVAGARYAPSNSFPGRVLAAVPKVGILRLGQSRDKPGDTDSILPDLCFKRTKADAGKEPAVSKAQQNHGDTTAPDDTSTDNVDVGFSTL